MYWFHNLKKYFKSWNNLKNKKFVLKKYEVVYSDFYKYEKMDFNIKFLTYSIQFSSISNF